MILLMIIWLIVIGAAAITVGLFSVIGHPALVVVIITALIVRYFGTRP
jgi:hypothetical protein